MTMSKNKLFCIVAFALVFSFAATLGFGAIWQDSGSSVALGEAVAATTYGAYSTDNEQVFWFYGENHINIKGLKAEISQWNLENISEPIVIAVVDTGINTGHDVFQKTNTILKNSEGVVRGYNSYNAANSTNPTPAELGAIADTTSDSHGTAVASAMAMMIYELGLQDYIKIYPIKASRSSTRNFPLSAVQSALDWAVDTQDSIGIDVVNLSFCTYDEEWRGLQQSMITLSESAVIVAAAGNGDDDHPNGYHTSEANGYPAKLSGAVSVMGYDSASNKSRASNYGFYDVCAPGTDILTARGSANNYQPTSGTSIAASFVSVLAAIETLSAQTHDEDVAPALIARHIRSSYSTNIVYTDSAGTVHNLPKLDALKCILEDVSEIYSDVTGIEIASDGVWDKTQTPIIYKDRAEEIKLTANLLPLGDINPAENEKVDWYLVEVIKTPVLDAEGAETDETVESYGKKTHIGSGKTLLFKPSVQGTYEIRAEYIRDGFTLSDYRRYTLYYVNYETIAGDVRVVLSDELYSSNPQTALQVYSDKKLTFGLTLVEYADPDVEIKWYVNGVYAASGTNFTFSANRGGHYVISAQYGDFRVVEKSFTVEVRHFMLRTENIVSIVVVAALLVAVAVVLIVINEKKKRGAKEKKN